MNFVRVQGCIKILFLKDVYKKKFIIKWHIKHTVNKPHKWSKYKIKIQNTQKKACIVSMENFNS